MVPPSIAHHAPTPDKASIQMAGQMAAFYAHMAPLTGCEGPTTEQILSKLHPPTVEPDIDPNHPVNIDIPYTKPGPQHVDTLCMHYVPMGSTRFEVHNMEGIVPGQCLSIEYEGIDMEPLIVDRLGSVVATKPLARGHAELSPVKLVKASKKSPPTAASGLGGSTLERRIPRKSAEDSDVEYEPPTDTNTAPSRKLTWPQPYHTGHMDVEGWDSLWVNNITKSNPLNHDRERTYREKCFQWSVNDSRLCENWTPSDMFGLDAMIREKVKSIADPASMPGLLDRMISEDNSWWTVTRRVLPSRKLMAMYYEYFRIAGPDVNQMYMQEFGLLDYDTSGDKNAGKWREAFKKAAANISHLLDQLGLTEALTSQLRKSKHLFVEELRSIRKEPDSRKWDYQEIGKMITTKLDEETVQDMTNNRKMNILLSRLNSSLVKLLRMVINRTRIRRKMLMKKKGRKRSKERMPQT